MTWQLTIVGGVRDRLVLARALLGRPTTSPLGVSGDSSAVTTGITFLPWGTPLTPVVWLEWFWPLALTLLLWLLVKPPRPNGIAFIVLGTFVGYGVQWVVHYFVMQLPASVPENLSEGERFVRILIINGYRSVVISTACAVPLVLWLRSSTTKGGLRGGDS